MTKWPAHCFAFSWFHMACTMSRFPRALPVEDWRVRPSRRRFLFKLPRSSKSNSGSCPPTALRCQIIQGSRMYLDSWKQRDSLMSVTSLTWSRRTISDDRHGREELYASTLLLPTTPSLTSSFAKTTSLFDVALCGTLLSTVHLKQTPEAILLSLKCVQQPWS
ncbi:hypothetical protein BDN67DRAFT_58153 [Paxillus ammoniavirescens]|nr:hypothetical protein BDN67DRAFT_58153 [Paxillus ammoniavirescens]